eukprot:jgi/Hompol1/6008/HPOL_004802-RA
MVHSPFLSNSTKWSMTQKLGEINPELADVAETLIELVEVMLANKKPKENVLQELGEIIPEEEALLFVDWLFAMLDKQTKLEKLDKPEQAGVSPISDKGALSPDTNPAPPKPSKPVFTRIVFDLPSAKPPRTSAPAKPYATALPSQQHRQASKSPTEADKKAASTFKVKPIVWDLPEPSASSKGHVATKRTPEKRPASSYRDEPEHNDDRDVRGKRLRGDDHSGDDSRMDEDSYNRQPDSRRLSVRPSFNNDKLPDGHHKNYNGSGYQKMAPQSRMDIDSSTMRCRYFPSCTRGAMCEYWHPIIECADYPNCQAGRNCLFLHPGDLETFQRVSAATTSTGIPASTPILSTASSTTVGNNTGTSIVPPPKRPIPIMPPPHGFVAKPCWNGAHCFAPNCPFAHPGQYHSRNMSLRNTAASATAKPTNQKTEQQPHKSERTFALSDTEVTERIVPGSGIEL